MSEFLGKTKTALELVGFLLRTPLWWVAPAAGLLLLGGILGLMADSGVISPFIYTLF